MPRAVKPPAASASVEDEIDARGLNCPMPVLLLRRALNKKPRGHEVAVLVTDPSAPKDFEKFCRNTGDVLVKIVSGKSFSSIHVRKA